MREILAREAAEAEARAEAKERGEVAPTPGQRGKRAEDRAPEMDERESQRLRLTREVMKLVRHRSLRDALPALRSDGTAPFVVALPDDSLGDLYQRAATVGGRVHVIIVDELAGGRARLRICSWVGTDPDGFEYRCGSMTAGELCEFHEEQGAEETGAADQGAGRG
jgi:hypothetical protein